MAQVTQVTTTVQRVFNLGDFHSLRVEMSATAVVDPEDDMATVGEGLREYCRNHVMAEIARVQPKLLPRVENLFMGVKLRPVDAQGNFVDEETEDAG